MSMPSADRRKQVRIRLRKNLVITPHEQRQPPFFVVKDPVTSRYFRFEAGQHFALGLMDGRHTLAEIQEAYERKFRPERLSLEELEAFAAHLTEVGLAQTESVDAERHCLEESQRRERREKWQKLLNIFCLRIPLAYPDRLLERLTPWGRVLFSPWSLALGILVFLAALGLVVTRWSELRARVPASQEFFQFHFLAYFWITLGLAKTLHELGHALCCKAQGGQVHSMGVMFLFFFPAFYCDVSDSWTLPGKWRRMAISAAGIYVELWLAALAVFVWWLSADGSVISHLAFALMVFCSVHTVVCNANPLMRFDGYYVLSDWLEVPNLAQQASQAVQTTVLRGLGADVQAAPIVGRTGPGFLLAYGVAGVVYRWIVWGFGLFFLYQFLKTHRLESLGMMLVWAGAALLLAGPASSVARLLFGRGRLPDVKFARLGVVAVLVAGVLGLFFAVPLPMKVRGMTLIQVDPDHVRRLVVPESGGFWHEARVQDGQHVKAGDILAVLTNPEVEIKLRVNEAEQALKREQQSTLVAQLADPAAADNQGHAALLGDFELRALLQEHAILSAQRTQLTLRAPTDGIVMGLRSIEDKGKWLEKGTELCHIGNPQTLRAIVLVEPAEQRFLSPGMPAVICVHGAGTRPWRGVVSGFSHVAARDIPPQLTLRAGGEVATDQDPVSKTEKPKDQHYLAAVRILDHGDILHPGVLGRLRIDAEPQTVWWRVHRFLGTTFQWGL